MLWTLEWRESLEFIQLIESKLCFNYFQEFQSNSLQLGDGLSFQWRQQPSGSEEAVLDNSQALQDVIAGRRMTKNKTQTYN